MALSFLETKREETKREETKREETFHVSQGKRPSLCYIRYHRAVIGGRIRERGFLLAGDDGVMPISSKSRILLVFIIILIILNFYFFFGGGRGVGIP